MIIINDELMKLEITASSSINDGLSCTLPETNSSHLKMDGWNTSFLFNPTLFSGAFAVSFRECNQIFMLQLMLLELPGVIGVKPLAPGWINPWKTRGRSFPVAWVTRKVHCWIRGSTNPQTYHVTLSKINSLNLKNWKWWFGSDDFPFASGVFSGSQPFIFRGVVQLVWFVRCHWG